MNKPLMWYTLCEYVGHQLITYYRIGTTSRDADMRFLPYIVDTSSIGAQFSVHMSEHANRSGVPDATFSTLQEAKDYVDSAIALGLEVIRHG